MSLARFRTFLIVLAVMIVGLMALGAGVRTMNAGLACPDWPLCFGKVIPDFHVAVWFEFVHRAYAGIVAIVYAVALVIALRSKEVPRSTKIAAYFGLAVLVAQIVMGGLTVLMLVKAVVVTMHLLLATLFLGCVLWMLFGVNHTLKGRTVVENLAAAMTEPSPDADDTAQSFRWLSLFLPAAVFLQIAIGGLVASTYAGKVCVDWPLCNGQWVPTLSGPMGLQVIHRFYAYGLVVLFLGGAIYAFSARKSLEKKYIQLFYAGGAVVILQTIVGVMNLLFFIPPQLAVLHQTLAMVLLAISLKLSFELRRTADRFETTKASGSPAVLTEPLS